MFEIGQKLNKAVVSREVIKQRINNINKQLDNLDDSLLAHVEAREIIQKAAQLTQG